MLLHSMNNFSIEVVDINDESTMSKVREFLIGSDLELDFVDYCIVIRNENKIIATCSKQFNLIKCISVCTKFNGLELANKLVTAILKQITSENYDEAFVITKFKNKEIFESMNFKSIYSNEKISFLTNRFDRFEDYKNYLSKQKQDGTNGLIVMNCNPFTLGHEFLIKEAAKQVDNLYIVPVLEDLSFFKYNERFEMMKQSISKMQNVFLLNGSGYIISKSVFPSYFLKSSDEVISEQTNLDSHIFVKLFKDALSIKKRFVGTEPISHTTNSYNETLNKVLTENKIELVVIPRLEINNEVVSASKVRVALANGDEKIINEMLPQTSIDVLKKINLEERLKEDADKIYKTN